MDRILKSIATPELHGAELIGIFTKHMHDLKKLSDEKGLTIRILVAIPCLH